MSLLLRDTFWSKKKHGPLFCSVSSFFLNSAIKKKEEEPESEGDFFCLCFHPDLFSRSLNTCVCLKLTMPRMGLNQKVKMTLKLTLIRIASLAFFFFCKWLQKPMAWSNINTSEKQQAEKLKKEKLHWFHLHLFFICTLESSWRRSLSSQS